MPSVSSATRKQFITSYPQSREVLINNLPNKLVRDRFVTMDEYVAERHDPCRVRNMSGEIEIDLFKATQDLTNNNKSSFHRDFRSSSALYALRSTFETNLSMRSQFSRISRRYALASRSIKLYAIPLESGPNIRIADRSFFYEVDRSLEDRLEAFL